MNHTAYGVFDSPLGKLTVATDGKSITALHIEGDRYFNEIPHEWIHNPKHQLLQKAKTQIREYFAGSRREFNLPLKTEGTVFQKTVWAALRNIPAGTTVSYGQIAQKIGKPDAVRAVGTAIGRNPVCVIVPCHRVLAGDGSLGGYVAGVKRKQQLLDLEDLSTIG